MMLDVSVDKLIHAAAPGASPPPEESLNDVKIESKIPQEYLQRFRGLKLHFKCFYDLTWTLMQAGV